MRNNARRLRQEVISHYSNGTNRCACCGESHFEFLTIDHIDGGGLQHRKRENMNGGQELARWLRRNDYPDGFQILCMNCNFAKGHYGRCPHESGHPETATMEVPS